MYRLQALTIAMIVLGVGLLADAAVIKSVQRGTATFTSGQNTLPVTLTAVDTTKTIVWGGTNWGGGRNASANANATRVGFQLGDGTTLNLQRLGSPTQATVAEWEAIEFLSGVAVKRGTAAFSTSATTVNVTIPAVTLAESFVLISVTANSTSATIDEEWTIRARLTTTTNLELTRNESGIALNVYWQVVSYTGASVQRGITSIASGSSSATAAITSVDLTKSFLVINQRGLGASNGIESQYQVRGRITSATQLTFDRISTTNSVDVAWEVVSLTDASTVQSGSIAVGTSATTGSGTLTAVTTSRTATLINVRGGTGTTTSNLDEVAFTHTLTSSTAVGVTRSGTGTAADVSWFAIQFPANQAPVLDSIRAKTVAEGANLSFRVHATDPDGTIPTFTAVGVPANATFVDSLNGAGSFVLNPDYTQSGVINVRFITSDGLLADSELVAITVTNTNRPPVLDAIGPKSVAEGTILSFGTHATDPDGNTPTLSAVDVPLNATFVDSLNGAGSLVFNPSYTQSGIYNVTFIASDGSLADSEVVVITVTNTNRPPVLDAIGPKNVAEGASLSFRTHATDPDGNTPTLSAVGVPLNATFVDSLNSAGSLVFNPSYTQSGIYNVTFIASDGSLADSEVVVITVTNTNRPPVLDAIGPKSVAEGTILSFRTHATDPDGNTPTLSAVGVPLNATFVDSLNGAGSLVFNPSYTQSGIYNVTFITSDGSLADSEVVAITVTNSQIAPSVTAGATQVNVSPVNRLGTNTTVISATFTDVDQPGVGAFTATFKIREPNNVTELTLVNNQPNGGGGLTITDNGGGSYTASYTYNPGDAQTLGLYDLYFAVSDGPGNATDGYTSNTDELTIIQQIAPSVTAGATQVSVSPVNRIGTNTTVISATFTDVDQPGVGAFTATFKIRDPNNVTELTLVNNQPNGGGGLTITDGGGGSYTASYTYNPDDAQTLGLYDLYFAVSDGPGNAIDGYTSNTDELTIIQQIAPSVTAGATQVSISPVNRFGTNTTVISATFSDADQPGVGAFTATFKIREPNNVTELTLVNNQPNGVGGLTITDNGGGSYTASYTYNPDDAQTLGLYDLYFAVSDGPGNAIDGYTNNIDELTINQQIAPSIIAGATQVSVSPVNRFGANTTVISATFTDTDQPGVGAFTATFKIREPNNVTELTLVNNQPNGGGGLTITDGGGGSYTASYAYDPGAAQTLGLYDLYFEVSDGAANAIDGYANNIDELQINEVVANNPPAVTAGVTQVSVSPVNRLGANTTVISATFTDVDQPGVGAFTATFKIREPNNVTELTLVNNQPNGGGGLTITDGGGGSYTASYTYDPGAAQTLGLYDLYFEVSDGAANAIDGYANNLDELQINEVVANNPPAVTAGATQVSVSPVNRLGANTTVISATFTDADQPGVGAFTATFKIREPNNVTELTLVNNQPNGGGGLTITDGGGGSYTASYTYNPNDAQTLGLYDLYFEVSDGAANAIDGYANNLDELQINEVVVNNPPAVTAGATQVSVSPVNRFGANTTVISATFTDADQPGVGAFTATFKIREPNNVTELTLVNNQPNGGGGLTITDGGGGSYTASYTYNPSDAQTLGPYDLYFEVSDDSANAIDSYASNLNELQISETVNNSPTVVSGVTQVSLSPVNRYAGSTTVISATFADPDVPGSSAFRCTFKIREPNNVTELVLVNNQPNSGGGLTITDGGGGSYTASYTWNSGGASSLGFYDLYFEVSDGTANAIDGYTSNLDELEVIQQIAPQITPGATQVSVSPANRYGSSSTVISAAFTDGDQPGVGAFTATFKIREPNNVTELTLVNNQPNGGGGLSITDHGGGSYTASYTYNPNDAQTLGLYDLHFEVSDGADNAIDDYASNLDELQISQQIAPQVTAGTTQVSVSPVNRYGSSSTVISAVFTDGDQPGIGVFNCTFRIRRPNNITELTLVNNQPNGAGGLSITDNGGGSYTASYTYDPGDVQTLGLYDLHFAVTDGQDSVIDGYTSNPDELQISQQIAPQVTAGTTQVSASPVNRYGANTTVISATFTDADVPGVGAFTCTFKIREPNNVTELTMVSNQPNGAAGLTITSGGGGSYTASYTYNPSDAQTLGLHDLYFEVSDGTANAVDGYASNLDELQISQQAAPQITPGATQVSISPVNRFAFNTTVLSATFSDSDQPGVGAFTVTFKIRQPNNTTELTLILDKPNGASGVMITDGGGGSYTASYTFNPDDAQVLGLYDLYFEVSDGIDGAIDGYTNNLDELQINEVFPNNPVQVSSSAAIVNVSPVNRFGSNTTVVSASFSDRDNPGIGAFTVTFKIRAPDNSTEVVLVNNQTHGSGGLTIVDNIGSYTARFTYDPPGAQTLGLYDLYFEVSDGINNAIDGYSSNLDELEINETIANNAPTLTTGVTAVAPVSLARFGGATTEISATFTDSDQPGINAFFVTFRVREPWSVVTTTIANALQHGQSGLTITDNGGGSYTARMNWNPPDNATLGYYDLYTLVSDGPDLGVDAFDNNPNELLVTNSGENAPPVVPADNMFATPAGVERTGANPTTLSAIFTDPDSPAVGVFRVTFKVRYPNNSGEITLANNVGHGTGGVSIINQGGAVYTASISWDPAATETLGVYDLYFHVTDGADTSFDGYSNNLDELEIHDAISNNAPAVVAGATSVLPASITRLGSEFTMIQTVFSDADVPGSGAFAVTIKVRNQALTEYTIVNAAHHKQQGLRIRHVSGNNYEASVLWDPPVGQVTGTYDLYFQVVDNNAAAASDNYGGNADELTVTATAIPGDGNLLRRTNNADNCGGANSACHNIADHQSQNCLVCHTPHQTKNIYLIRETIQTPNSGAQAVVFKTLGIGDPYNGPDPSPGDPASGVMADSTDSVFTGICEVCHTTAGHHRNNGSQPPPNHNDAKDCTVCHPHADGFAVSGGGESGGGSNCTCHSSIFSPLNTSTTSYHHQVNSDAADYTISSKTCLMCHVDHNIFRPDLNTGIGQRSKNLRADITTTVVQGSNTVLANSDYSSTGTGGICLSCHTSLQTKGYTQPDGTTQTPALLKSDYDAATSAHNYNVPSTFSTDGSTFNANCVKCHNDAMTKSYQNSTNKFSAHDSPYRRILARFGIASPSDPLEEKVCYQCHSTTSNPNAGTSKDYYAVKSITNPDALDIEAAFSRTYNHPTGTYSGRHKPIETASNLADGNRHAECEDCHDPHAAQQGTHDGTTNLVSNALKGTWGVQPTSWPTPAVPTNNGNVFTAPSGYTKVDPATKEYQICLKCHSNYTTLPSGSRNLAAEINPNYPSQHGIVQAGNNTFCNATTMNAPWGTSKIAWCSDCHRSSNAADPNGPHGSNVDHLLVATITSDVTNGTPLCNVCHKSTVYWSGSATASRFPDHPAGQGAHRLANGCFSCHMWDYASTAGLGVQTTNWGGGVPPAGLFVHGQNKKWVYYEVGGTAGTQNAADAFVNGYIANHDVVNKSCWSETCRTHSSKTY